MFLQNDCLKGWKWEALNNNDDSSSHSLTIDEIPFNWIQPKKYIMKLKSDTDSINCKIAKEAFGGDVKNVNTIECRWKSKEFLALKLISLLVKQQISAIEVIKIVFVAPSDSWNLKKLSFFFFCLFAKELGMFN